VYAMSLLQTGPISVPLKSRHQRLFLERGHLIPLAWEEA